MNRSPESRHVAVIGGGWAGCAAAAALADAGIAVTLYEQAPVLGGRARTVELDGASVDNGQHLLLGAYGEVLDLLRRLHGSERAAALLHRFPLTLQPFGMARADGIAITAPRWPAPMHLVLALLRARGLSWRERAALVSDFTALAARGFAVAPGTSVAACFAATPPRAFSAVWDPLCIAALNTPSSAACAQTFASVLKEAFTGARAKSDFLVPAVHLGALVPDAMEGYLARTGGAVHIATRVRSVEARSSGAIVATDGGRTGFEAVIVAVSPHRLAQLDVQPVAPAYSAALRAVASFRYEPITTVYVAYDELPLATRMAQLDAAPGQWIFDRGPLVRDGQQTRLASVVISASGPHDALDHATLVSQVDAQLRRLEPRVRGRRWARVIAERRATYACTPGLERPRAGCVGARTYLAGDYTDARFPATLEAAVRSGNAAARALMADLR